MDARVTNCLRCDKPLPETGRGRPQRFCSDRCRKAHSRINGHENGSDGPTYPGGKKHESPASQPIDFVKAGCPFNREWASIVGRPSFSNELRFEEWPPRTSKKATCITYKLTDGKQINIGYGRTSRRLGYVMEIADGRWIARVRNRRSDPLPLGAAKEAAIELYRSRHEGQPRDWIHELNNLVARFENKATGPKRDTRALRRPVVDLAGITLERLAHIVAVECNDDATLRSLETSFLRLVHSHHDEPISIQTDKNDYPELPAFMDRREKKAKEQAA